MEALASIHGQGEPAWAPILSRWYGEEGGKRDEGWQLAIVEVLVELDPDHATAFLSQRLSMGLRSKLGGIVGTPEQIRTNRIVAQGLALAATPGALEKLREVRTQGDEEWREHVNRLLFEARRRAEGRPA
jgi:alkylation response protein AidB-like acyl-CoA dehydrogenase